MQDFSSDYAAHASHLDWRARLAITSGRLAAKSRASRRGAGGVIGGRVASFLDSDVTQKIAHSMHIALVSGTNGKSTTTKMLNAALRTAADVAYNDHGDNMESGVTAALLQHPHAPFASLEIDEMHLGKVAAIVNPSLFVLLNLTRDQLDRVGSPLRVQQCFAQTLAQFPNATVIANCDDPLIAAAAWHCSSVVWVAAGTHWKADAKEFPLGGTVTYNDNDWWVDDTYRRPQPEWWLENEFLVHRTADGQEHKYLLQLSVPGAYNRGNAAQAVAAAYVAGIEPERALSEIAKVTSVAGRYAQYHYAGKTLRMLLAKNPAGWQETLPIVKKADALLLAVNAQVPDGEDPTWLKDIDFSILLKLTESATGSNPDTVTDMPIYICGEASDVLQSCLAQAGIQANVVASAEKVLAMSEIKTLEVVANYTAFRDIKNILDAS